VAGVRLSGKVRNYIRTQLKAKLLNEMMGRTHREREREREGGYVLAECMEGCRSTKLVMMYKPHG
jgi:hypothetical protein